MQTRTHIVLLMHPMEWRREKCTTGRLACLNLANSEIIPGLAFDENPRYRALVDDPANYPVLLYPGPGAIDLCARPFPEGGPFGETIRARRLVAFIVDATWACSRAVLRASPSLLALPRMMFTPREKSRWIIKRQPADYCLSTIETIHELLRALEEAGLERYPDKERLLSVFAAMQEYQVRRAEETPNYRFIGKGKMERGST
jgi:DTW domain-containing protein YfiP